MKTVRYFILHFILPWLPAMCLVGPRAGCLGEPATGEASVDVERKPCPECACDYKGVEQKITITAIQDNPGPKNTSIMATMKESAIGMRADLRRSTCMLSCYE